MNPRIGVKPGQTRLRPRRQMTGNGGHFAPRPARFSKLRRSSHGQEERRKQNPHPIADRIVHIPCPIRRQVLNPFQADGQGQTGRDDQPDRMPGKSEAPGTSTSGRAGGNRSGVGSPHPAWLRHRVKANSVTLTPPRCGALCRPNPDAAFRDHPEMTCRAFFRQQGNHFFYQAPQVM